MRKTVSVLMIEDSESQAVLILGILKKSKSIEFNVDLAGSLSEGLSRLAKGGYDAVLTDLSLPDSDGLHTVKALRSCSPGIPIVVLTNSDDEELASRALQVGAQDYLVKAEVDANWLTRSLKYAIERQSTWHAPALPQAIKTPARKFLEVETRNDQAKVVLLSEVLVDHLSIKEISRQIGEVIDSGCNDLRFSLEKVDYMANEALQMLISVHLKMQKAQGRMLLCNVRPSVRDSIAIRRLNTVLEIEPSDSA